MVQELRLQLRFEKHPDGRYRIRSDEMPELRLEGPDFDALQRDIDPVVSDLLLHNLGFDVEDVRWVPSLEDVKHHLQTPSPNGIATFVARLKAA